MYLFDISLMNSQRWRITHGQIHHMFPNTLLDIELTQFEPMAYFTPVKTNRIYPYFSATIMPFLGLVMTIGDNIKVITF